MTFVEIGLQD